MLIKNLNVTKESKQILKNLEVEFQEGHLHVIMGSNGSGKSTLVNSIAGNLAPDDTIEGSVLFHDKNLLDMKIHERALEGVHLSPQYPPVIEGLSHAAFMKEALNVRRSHHGLESVDEFEFLKLLKEKAKLFSFDPKSYIRQSFNSGFSGGEKKRNEMLQISLLEPSFIILDEIDSGLDIESMSNIASFINSYVAKGNTAVVITHYPQFAQMLNPSFVHIVKNGTLAKTGGQELIWFIEQNGFGEF